MQPEEKILIPESKWKRGDMVRIKGDFTMQCVTDRVYGPEDGCWLYAVILINKWLPEYGLENACKEK